jgi:hypothetical protein
VSYYQEKVWVITKKKGAVLPRENVTHYNEEVWVITKRKCGLLPREGVGYD